MARVASQTLSRRVRGVGGVHLWAAFFLIVGGIAADAQESRRPNIVFVLSDDHNHSVLGIAGNPSVKTPISIDLPERGPGSVRHSL